MSNQLDVAALAESVQNNNKKIIAKALNEIYNEYEDSNRNPALGEEMPDMNGMDNMDEMPDMNGMDNMDEMPDMDNMDSMDSMDEMPDMDKMDSMDSMDGMKQDLDEGVFSAHNINDHMELYDYIIKCLDRTMDIGYEKGVIMSRPMESKLNAIKKEVHSLFKAVNKMNKNGTKMYQNGRVKQSV